MDNIPVYYVNSARIATGVNDIQITMYKKNNITAIECYNNKEEYYGEPIAEIIMSPNHAKSILKVLQSQIENYENIFGLIGQESEELPRLEK